MGKIVSESRKPKAGSEAKVAGLSKLGEGVAGMPDDEDREDVLLLKERLGVESSSSR